MLNFTSIGTYNYKMNILFIIMNDTKCLEFYNNNLKGKVNTLKDLKKLSDRYNSYTLNEKYNSHNYS